jgi:hypothetical protein
MTGRLWDVTSIEEIGKGGTREPEISLIIIFACLIFYYFIFVLSPHRIQSTSENALQEKTKERKKNNRSLYL